MAVTFKLRLEKLGGKNLPGGEKGVCGSPQAGESVVCSRNRGVPWLEAEGKGEEKVAGGCGKGRWW